jgi:CRP-like cAMP-binding protein
VTAAFGELALLDGAPHAASVVAEQGGRLLRRKNLGNAVPALRR